ncbi:MAG: triphosphoribosyl-dephospho-CoA synthase [Candidatus Odinarchaeota archaeon]
MSSEETNFDISVNSLDDLLRCLNLASLLEVTAWPKPGNISKWANFEKTKFEHFMAGIVAIQPIFRVFTKLNFQKSFRNEEDYKSIELGYYFKKAAEEMIRWQDGGNVLLGHILILTPLAVAAVICMKKGETKISELKNNLNKVIENSSVYDTINLYQTIRLCNPGGLGKVERYDINDKNSFKELKNDNINLKKIFNLSKEYDLISLEYSNGFDIILNQGLPYFVKIFNEFKDINIAIVNTYLKLLSLNPDSLVIRKSGRESALKISDAAANILNYRGISSEKGLKLAIELDNELQKEKGKLNPGTTADLISGVIFCALLIGLRF